MARSYFGMEQDVRDGRDYQGTLFSGVIQGVIGVGSWYTAFVKSGVVEYAASPFLVAAGVALGVNGVCDAITGRSFSVPSLFFKKSRNACSALHLCLTRAEQTCVGASDLPFD